MNRVNQIYDDDLAIRMVLINHTDKLNLNTAAEMTERQRPVRRARRASPRTPDRAGCPATAAQAQPIVIGQIIGASNYDIGHIALGINGGGIA